MNQDKHMITTIQQLKAALTGRNQDYGDVAELVDQIKRKAAELTNEVKWVRRWTAPGKLNEAETCRDIAAAWNDEKCQQAYVLLRAHHEREAGKYANGHMAAIMVACSTTARHAHVGHGGMLNWATGKNTRAAIDAARAGKGAT